MNPLVPLAPFARSRVVARVCLALAVLAALQPAAFAQTAYPAAAPSAGAPAQPLSGDPPDRVARLDYLSGAVTTEPAGASDWSYAAVNRPLTTGDQIWNDANARSEMHIGSTAVRLGPSTNLAILNLDDTTTQLKVPLGTLSTHVRELPPGSSYEIDTPNLALAVDAPGDYRVDVAPDGSTTAVTVRRGAVTAYGEGAQLPITAGQRVVFSGTGLQVADSSRVPPPDALDAWAARRDAAEDRSVSARYVSRDIPGYQDLDANGTWREDPQYGAVWIPSDVPAGWAPYRTGHWIWQPPWGWTWVDDEPWGFAPYHYGRWAYIDDDWAWVPGPVVAAPPVYAPALVAFVGGDGGGFSWSVGLAAGIAGVAWFPLGPHEVWRPSWGGWSPSYFDRVNRTVIVNNVNVTNITQIHNTYINYRAPNAVTAVPATAFVHGQPVARFAHHVDPRQWHNVRLGSGAPGVAPVRQSFTGGLRQAANRPPAPVMRRSIVATRNPVVPAVYRDRLAQNFARHGNTVPGAGAPVLRRAVPPDYRQRPVAARGGGPQSRQWQMHNVRLVQTHTPVAQPGRAAQPAAGGPARANLGPRAVPGRAVPQAPRGNVPAAAGHNNGVPRPPMSGFAAHPQEARPGAMQPGRPAPTPRVPHPPRETGRAAPFGGQPNSPHAMQPGRTAPTPEAARPAAPAMRNALPQQHQPIRANRAPEAPRAPAQPNRAMQAPPRAPMEPHRAPEAPRNAYRPPAEARPAPHVAPAPRMAPAARVAPEPHMEPAPHMAPAPRMAPAPHIAPQPAPRAAPPVEHAPAPRNEPRPARPEQHGGNAPRHPGERA